MELEAVVFLDLLAGRATTADLKRPLTPEEQSHLAAGIAQIASSPLMSLLAGRGLLEERPSSLDPHLRSRLAKAQEDCLWRFPGGGPAAGLLGLVEAAHASRQVFRYDLGQTPLLPESVVRKALLCPGRRARVLVLGDDDFLALPLGALGHEVTALDADAGLLALEEAAARENALDFDRMCCDLRDPLPAALRGAFEVAYLEPSSETPAMRMFLSRAAAALVPGGRALVAVTPHFARRFARIADEAGFEPLERRAWFSAYYTPRIEPAPFVTDLWTLKRGPHSRPLVPPEEPWPQPAAGAGPVLHATLDLFGCARGRFTPARLRAFASRALGGQGTTLVPAGAGGQGGAAGAPRLWVAAGPAGTALFQAGGAGDCLLVDVFWRGPRPMGVDLALEARKRFVPQRLSVGRQRRGAGEDADLPGDCPPLGPLSFV